MSWKDAVTFTMALIAFLLSLFNFYSTNIRQIDEVSIVISGFFNMERTPDGKLTLSNPDLTVILINSGTRGAAILSFVAIYVQTDRKPEEECSQLRWDDTIRFQTTLETVVVKEKEVITKSLKLSSVYGLPEQAEKVGDDFKFSVRPEYKDKDYVSVVGCYEVSLATPSVSYHSVNVPGDHLAVMKEGGIVIAYRAREDVRPYTLIRKRSFQFSL